MNLVDSLNSLIDTFSLKAPDPKQDHPWHLYHLHADFIELKSMLWDKNSSLNIQDIITHYKDFNIDIGVKKSPLLMDQISSSNSEINDEWQSRMREIFDVLEEREIIYNNDYPFIIEKNSIILKQTLNDRQKLYLILLIASNLNNFTKVNSVITSEFETISKCLAEDFFPKIRFEEFGQNSLFKGNTESKIKELSSLLNIGCRSEYISSISKFANKEKGLDVVGWGPFSDDIANMFILLAQCACGKDWTKKISDTKSYESYLDFVRMKPIHAMFVPYGLAHYDYNFYQAEKTNGYLFFERKRFLNISDEKLSELIDLDSFKIVDELLKNDFVEV